MFDTHTHIGYAAAVPLSSSTRAGGSSAQNATHNAIEIMFSNAEKDTLRKGQTLAGTCERKP
jgi:hypothetical protein